MFPQVKKWLIWKSCKFHIPWTYRCLVSTLSAATPAFRPSGSSVDYWNRFATGLVASSHSLYCPPLINLSNMQNLTMSLVDSRPISGPPLCTEKSLKSLKWRKALRYFDRVYLSGILLPLTTLNFIFKQHQMCFSFLPCWVISCLCTFGHAQILLMSLHNSIKYLRLRSHYFFRIYFFSLFLC